MNKISFAVAAVYGASMAKAQATCQSTTAPPDQQMADKMALAELNFSYLDACGRDGKVTYEEFEALAGDIGEGGRDRAENVRKYQLMDLNNDNEISLVELLQHYRVKYSPPDLQGSLPPFKEVKDSLFDYIKCRPDPASADQTCRATGYTKEDLKAVLPAIYALDNIINDRVSYEIYAMQEFRIRDTNYDGIVEKWEQDKYDNHYKHIRGFWNHSKGAGNVQETIEDDGKMTYEEWNKQDNMMLKRDYPNSDIPQSDLEGRFRYFDRNQDGELSWWEYWSTIQEDDLQFYHFHRLYMAIAGDQENGGLGHITRENLTAYYQQETQGSIADSAIADMVEDFFLKYNDHEVNGNGDDKIGKWEMWPKYHWAQHVAEYNTRRDYRNEMNFEDHIFGVWDNNGDKQWSYDELISHMTHEDALEIYTALGGDITAGNLVFVQVKQFMEARAPMYSRTYGDYPKDYTQIDTSNPEMWEYLGVNSQAELDALFLQMDVNSDGVFDYSEICRHFVHDSDWFCGGDRIAWDKQEVQPDFKKHTPFEIFWNQFDDDHMSSDLSSVEMANWINAASGVDLFEEMSADEVLAQFGVHDLNGDGTVTVEEAYQVWTHEETVEEVTQRVQQIWDEVDKDEDGELDSTEFIATFNVLKDIGVVPETSVEEVQAAYDYVLAEYNSTAQTPVDKVPTVAVLYIMKDVAGEAWGKFLEQIESDEN